MPRAMDVVSLLDDDGESVGEVENGDALDFKHVISRHEQMMRKLAQQQERYSSKLLAKIEDLSSRQDVAFQQVQQSLEGIVLPRSEIRPPPTSSSDFAQFSAPAEQGSRHVQLSVVPAPESQRESSQRDSSPREARETTNSSVPAPRASAAFVVGNKMKRHIMKPFETADKLQQRNTRGWNADGSATKAMDDVEDPGGLRCSKFIVRSQFFEPFCTFMLISNAIFIGISVEHRAQILDPKLPVAYEVVDYVYTVWFVVELLLRGTAAGCVRFFTDPLDQNWNLFDLFVVGISVLEKIVTIAVADAGAGLLGNLSAIRAVRVMRVARVARVIRVMRFFRSFRILCSALFSTAKSCLWTSILLTIILYMFALVFAQAVADYRISIAPDVVTRNLIYYYGSLPRGMFTLFKSMVGGIDWEIAVEALSDVGALYVALFIIMLVFVYLALMNVMSGLFLQNALEQASTDKEDVIQEQLRRKKQYVHKVVECFRDMASDGGETITLEDFETHLKDERMTGFLQSLEIETADAWTLFKLLDVDGGGTVSISEFVDGVLRMRGNAKSVHLAQLMFENKWQMEALTEIHKSMEHRFAQIDRQLKSAFKHPPNNGCTVTKFDNHHKPEFDIKPFDSDFVLKPIEPDMVRKPMGTAPPPTTAPVLPCELVEDFDN